MRRALWLLMAVVLILVAVALGYRWGATTAAPAAAVSPVVAPSPERKVLYYRNPMGLADTSSVPKKDSMGMDYIPVYEDEESGGPQLRISPERLQKLGVRTETVALRELARTVRAVGTLQVNERLQHTVAAKFEGWVERLLVATTGERVRRGQPLMEVYSPELVGAQQDYLIAWRGAQALKDAPAEMQANMQRLMQAAVQRLRYWNIPEDELARLQAEGTVRNALTLRSPAEGVVIEKPAVQGMRFMPGEPLYRIADLSSLWLIAEVFEQDLGLVRAGQAARVRIDAYPDREFRASVAYIYPTTNEQTRTTPVRFEIANAAGLLRPAMYASVELSAVASGRVLAVPGAAVIDSGVRRIALVALGEGRFEPRELTLGRRSDEYVEVLRGLTAGEQVVIGANFLIDAESNLRAALGSFGSAPAAAGAVSGRTHRAEGRVESVDAKAGTASIAHAPVPSLKWPAMTMDFRVKDAAILGALRPGASVSFEFGEGSAGEWVVVRAEPLAAAVGDARAPAQAASPGVRRSTPGAVPGADRQPSPKAADSTHRGH